MIQQRTWGFDEKAARREFKPSSSDKLTLERSARCFVEELKETYIKPPPKRGQCNYMVDIGAKWHTRYFYFFATFHCPGPNAISPSFNHNVARMEWLAPDLFDLAFYRHTGEWITIEYGKSARQCFNAIKKGPWFFH